MDELDFDTDPDDLASCADLDADEARDLEASLAALERRGGVEAAFRAALREVLEGHEADGL